MFFVTPEIHAGKGYSSGGGRSYSSGARVAPSIKITPSVTPSIKITPSITPKPSYSSGGKGYSASSNPATPSTGPPRSYSSKPVANFQSMAATEQRKVESRAQYQKATAPKESYTTPKGNTVTIKNDARTTQIRNLPQEKWVTRETRVQTFYHSYYSTPPVVVHYNDPYSTFFWLWMLDRSLDDRAYWAYHHRYEMDDARYRDMLLKDQKLEARIKQLEAENKARDPNYVPSGMGDADLQYTDEYVNAVYNPEPKPYHEVTVYDFFYGLWILIKWLFLIAIIIGIIWFFFFMET
jgi:hypothetical protein